MTDAGAEKIASALGYIAMSIVFLSTVTMCSATISNNKTVKVEPSTFGTFKVQLSSNSLANNFDVNVKSMPSSISHPLEGELDRIASAVDRIDCR